MQIVIQSPYALERAGIATIVGKIWPEASVTEGGTAEEVALGVGKLKAGDLLIVDWRLETDAARLASDVSKKHPDMPIVAISESGAMDVVRRIVGFGVKAVLPVTASPAVVEAMLPFVMAGGSYVPMSVLGEVANDSPIPMPQRVAPRSSVLQEDPIFRNLTRRQREVLRLVAMGLSNEEIAEEMDVTLNTVKSHVSSMLRALGVKRRTQAMKMLGDMGMGG